MEAILISMRIFLIFLFSFSQLALGQNHDLKACRDLERRALTMVRNINSMFNKQVEVKFLKFGKEPPAWAGGVQRPPNLLDANAANKNELGREVIELPRPCFMSEKSLPSKELWSFIIAHEYSHKLIDKNDGHCYGTFLRTNDSAFSIVERERLNDVHHTNCDVMGLKILSHLNVDGRAGISDLKLYIDIAKKDMGDEVHQAFLKRTAYMSRIWPTDFDQGKDFLAGEYFDGITEIQHLLKRRYPHSKLLVDLESKISGKVEGCLLFKTERIRDSLALWKQLNFLTESLSPTQADIQR